MYRIVFFKIPFMRRGYRVPACPFGDSPITHMAGYKVTEVVTDFAFAETQREIVVNGDTAIAIDNGAANYAYIAQTNSEAIGVYTNDRRPAYYWVEDLQFVGVQGNDTPAAVVTISPDVWLTDFFPNMPTVRGRLAQSTKLMAGEPRTPLVAPVYDTAQLLQYDALVPNGTAGFYTIGVFSTERGTIIQFIMLGATFTDAQNNIFVLSDAASYTQYLNGKPGITVNISCIRIYVLPGEFLTTTDGTPLVDTGAGSRWEIRIKTAQSQTEYNVWDFIDSADLDGVGLRRVKNVNTPSAAGLVLNDINCRSWIVTPGRFVELSAQRGIKTPSGADPTLAAFFISAKGNGDDGIKIYLQVGEEFIDVSDDFVADIAPNETAVQQAQQKQLIALQAITGVIGAAGGFAGGVASGNYYGAVQAAAGGIETIAGISAERRRPPQMKSNGGVTAFYGFAKTLVLLISTGTPMNSSSVADTEDEFGWKYDNAPFVKYEWPDIDLNNFYRFSDVVVENVTGGTATAMEIAEAFAAGVRLVSL